MSMSNTQCETSPGITLLWVVQNLEIPKDIVLHLAPPGRQKNKFFHW